MHLPTFLPVNLYSSKAAAEAHLTIEDKWTLLYCPLLCYLIKKKSAAKFSVVIIFFKVFMCGGRVCLFVCTWMHVG